MRSQQKPTGTSLARPGKSNRLLYGVLLVTAVGVFLLSGCNLEVEPHSTRSYALGGSFIDRMRDQHFDLQGTDNGGDRWTGTLRLRTLPATQLDPWTTRVSGRRELQHQPSQGLILATHTYELDTQGRIVRIIRDDGVHCFPVEEGDYPRRARVGEAGSAGVWECSDGRGYRSEWALEATDQTDRARLVITYTFPQSMDNERYSLLISPAGQIEALESIWTVFGYGTLRMTGVPR